MVKIHPNFTTMVSSDAFYLALTQRTVSGFTGDLVKDLFTEEQLQSMTFSGTVMKERDVTKFPQHIYLAITGIFSFHSSFSIPDKYILKFFLKKKKL